MNKTKIVGLSLVLVALFTTNCFASTDNLKQYELNKTISVQDAENFKNSIENEITIDNVKYQLEAVNQKENKEINEIEKEKTLEKVVKTNDKYNILNSFEGKIKDEQDGMKGILELQNNSLEIRVNDSYKEEYKVYLTKKYNNVSSNELNNIPKTIKENGTTFYLINPVWNVSKIEKVEGQEVPIEYSGEMNYEGIKERTIIKNYLAKVTYKGTLEKEEVKSITFNLKYKEVPEEKDNNYVPIAVATGSGIVFVSGIILYKRKKKNNKVK